ncbi:MAG TPA: aldolase/citrate lyase family protein [Microbacteriaceae bacterium]|nr:aldolase/citrate lyase family protein [Microbacteriaceae bacterium]
MPDLQGLRGLLASGSPLATMLMNIPDPAVAEILGRSGVDYIVIDTEHAFFPSQSLRECIAAVRSTPAKAVVRVAANEEHLIKTVLDLGADGVQVPNVRTAAEAERAVAFARFAPEGTRGVGYGRASGHGTDIIHYVGRANRETAVILMIESGSGVDAADAIAAVPGVDALVVGPADLAVDLGVGLGGDPAPLEEAYLRVLEAGRRQGVAVAVGGGIEDARRWYDRGARVFLHFVDTLALAQVATSSVDATRAALGTHP